MTREEATAYLERDGNLRVPCSRYGWDTVSCVPAAIAAETILLGETGEGFTEDSLDHTMGLVVNDHDDIEYLIRNYGKEYGFDPADYLEDES